MFAFFIFQEHTEQMQYGNTSTNRLMVWYERGWDLYFVTTLKKNKKIKRAKLEAHTCI